MFKEMINQKRARNLMKQITKIDRNFNVKLIESLEYGGTKELSIRIDDYWFKEDKFAKLIKLLMEECIKHKYWMHGYADNYIQITIKYR